MKSGSSILIERFKAREPRKTLCLALALSIRRMNDERPKAPIRMQKDEIEAIPASGDPRDESDGKRRPSTLEPSRKKRWNAPLTVMARWNRMT